MSKSSPAAPQPDSPALPATGQFTTASAAHLLGWPASTVRYACAQDPPIGSLVTGRFRLLSPADLLTLQQRLGGMRPIPGRRSGAGETGQPEQSPAKKTGRRKKSQR